MSRRPTDKSLASVGAFSRYVSFEGDSEVDSVRLHDPVLSDSDRSRSRLTKRCCLERGIGPPSESTQLESQASGLQPLFSGGRVARAPLGSRAVAASRVRASKRCKSRLANWVRATFWTRGGRPPRGAERPSPPGEGPGRGAPAPHLHAPHRDLPR